LINFLLHAENDDVNDVGSAGGGGGDGVGAGDAKGNDDSTIIGLR